MQITRLYKGREHVEVEFIVSEADGCLILTSSFFTRFYLQYLPSQVGPIPIEDGIGKEVATQITTTMETNKTFYTDSNGRDFIKRVKCCSIYLIHLALWCGAVQLEMHWGWPWKVVWFSLLKPAFHLKFVAFLKPVFFKLQPQKLPQCQTRILYVYPSFHIHAQNGCWLKILISSQQYLGLSFENRCEHSWMEGFINPNHWLMLACYWTICFLALIFISDCCDHRVN